MFTKLGPQWDPWKKTAQEIRTRIPQVSYSTWIEPLFPIGLDDDPEKTVLALQVPDQYIRNALESRYRDKILAALSDVTGIRAELQFLLPDEVDKFIEEHTPVAVTPPPSAETVQLNPKYTFDTFVIGNSNRFVHAASLAVAEAPGDAYNPLFIYGGVGLGKTHLMHAIGHFIQENMPQKSIVYVSSEKFMNDMIQAISSNSTPAFRNKYRRADVLMIDDIQFLAGKTSTQEELFHTFNDLYESHKQIIISSDRPPKELKTLEARLTSRFEWGLIADIQPPDLETRIAILQRKADAEGLPSIDTEILEFIAANFANNIRELEGSLTKVIAFSRLSGIPINMDTVQLALGTELNTNAGTKVTPETIMKMVCETFNITKEEFLSRKRNQEIAHPRKIAMYLAREMTDYALAAIGDVYGGRDHTTVLHAWRTISEEVGENSELRILISDLRRRMLEK